QSIAGAAEIQSGGRFAASVYSPTWHGHANRPRIARCGHLGTGLNTRRDKRSSVSSRLGRATESYGPTDPSRGSARPLDVGPDARPDEGQGDPGEPETALSKWATGT